MATSAPDTSQRIVLGWKPGIHVGIHEGLLVIENLNRPFRLRLKQGFEERAIQLLREHRPEAEIADTMVAEFGINALGWTHQFLNYAKSRGCLCYSLREGEKTLLRLIPLQAGVRPPDSAPSQATLSATATIRFEGETIIIEDPQAKARAELACPTLAAQLLAPTDADSELTQQAWCLLAGAALARPQSENQSAPAHWQPHEAYFHYRSRMGGHDYKYGGTFPGKKLGISPPPLTPPTTNTLIQLPASTQQGNGKDFFSVTDARRSIRTYADRKLELQELADFLHWSVRFRSVISEDGMDMGFKPVASGGAIHEVEVYPCVRQVTGLEDGLYRYDAVNHALEKLAPPAQACQPLFDMAWVVNGQQGRPPVVITLAVNMERIAWKYESVAYALALKHVGVIYQQFYLVATALGLAPCALGGGDSHLFASISGIDPQQCPAIGEFILGPRADIPPSQTPDDTPSAASVVRQYLAALGQQNIDAVIPLLDPGLDHQIPGLPPGRDAFIQMLATYQAGFTEWALKVESLHTAGPTVTSKTVVSGLHTAPFLGHAPTNKRFSVGGLSLYQVEGDKIVKLTEMFDTFGMLKQLGIV